MKNKWHCLLVLLMATCLARLTYKLCDQMTMPIIHNALRRYIRFSLKVVMLKGKKKKSPRFGQRDCDLSRKSMRPRLWPLEGIFPRSSGSTIGKVVHTDYRHKNGSSTEKIGRISTKTPMHEHIQRSIKSSKDDMHDTSKNQSTIVPRILTVNLSNQHETHILMQCMRLYWHIFHEPCSFLVSYLSV